ncbi:MAG: radical SAM protein [Desulfobacterales bacterium]|nr:radical SAM protein [Desulfobacterales bacterium]MDD4393286.1 radical SAM protein [Desulfobacterales bacterium]
MEGNQSRRSSSRKPPFITAVVANERGEIFDLQGYAAVGMDGPVQVPLTVEQTVNLPYGGEMMFLPDRYPVVYNMKARRIETLKENPFVPGEAVFPVAAFNSPGYVTAYVTAYQERDTAGYLPLFSYGAAGWYRGKFRSAVICVDREKRQDLRLMKREDVIRGVSQMRKIMPDNRLRRHLETCALEYGCPAGKNFFLKRYEAPLPTSQACNARCLGCISLQTSEISSCQRRISFTPSPEEIAEVALEHIRKVRHSVLSFGQGCEGDPLLAADVIEPAIRLIRSRTPEGTINMNTNASLPSVLKKLFGAGLDSMRVSLNSVRQDCYHAYFRPAGYHLRDVEISIDTALDAGKFVSVNYLNCPGFTDTPEELEAMLSFIRRHPIHMIQWRNLNFDPLRYISIMNKAGSHGIPVGMATVLQTIRSRFPHVMYGYFNPPKEKFHLAGWSEAIG